MKSAASCRVKTRSSIFASVCVRRQQSTFRGVSIKSDFGCTVPTTGLIGTAYAICIAQEKKAEIHARARTAVLGPHSRWMATMRAAISLRVTVSIGIACSSAAAGPVEQNTIRSIAEPSAQC